MNMNLSWDKLSNDTSLIIIGDVFLKNNGGGGITPQPQYFVQRPEKRVAELPRSV